MLWDGREPRLQELVTANYDFDTYLDIMTHPGTPFGKLEYLAAAALYGMRLLVHRGGKQTVAFWQRQGSRPLMVAKWPHPTDGGHGCG